MKPASGRGWQHGLATTLVVASVGVAMLTAGQALRRAGDEVLRALWTLGPITLLHLVQLRLSSSAWRGLLPVPRPGGGTFFRIRLIRESINALLPVAHVGGDLVGIRLLASAAAKAAPPTLATAAASVVVDLTLEVASQVLFLLAGLAILALLVGATPLRVGLAGMVIVVVGVVGLALAQQLGGLRLVEALIERFRGQWAAFPLASLSGMDVAARALYGRPVAVLRSVSLHTVSWALGSFESWIILHALDIHATLLAAIAMESLGMAARSAGFLVPGALGVQEGGFALAATAIGLPGQSGLAVSLVKRLREIVVGVAGLAVWRA